ncbi:MAG: hypothetical protein AAGB46_03525, partial [Verrucomicrobiota bacterium]
DFYGEDRAIDRQQLSEAEQVLERISDETGGVFRRATDYESLKGIYEEINVLETSKIETRSFEIVSEVFWAPLALSLVVLAAWMLLNSTWLRVAE